MRIERLQQNENFPQCSCSQAGEGSVTTAVPTACRKGCSFSGICRPQAGKYDNKNIRTGTYHLLTAEAASCELRQAQRRPTVSLRAPWNGSQPSGLGAAQTETMCALFVPSRDTAGPLQMTPHARHKDSSSAGEPGPQECWL